MRLFTKDCPAVPKVKHVSRPVWRVLCSAFMAGMLTLGVLVPAWAQLLTTPLTAGLTTGRVTEFSRGGIIIDGTQHRVSPSVVVKWDVGGPASLENIRSGDSVQFRIKDFQIVLLIIQQPG